MEDAQTPPTYTGRASGMRAGFRKAAKDAERLARADLEGRGQWPPPEPIKYRARMYVRMGNPIHEYVVELTPER